MQVMLKSWGGTLEKQNKAWYFHDCHFLSTLVWMDLSKACRSLRERRSTYNPLLQDSALPSLGFFGSNIVLQKLVRVDRAISKFVSNEEKSWSHIGVGYVRKLMWLSWSEWFLSRCLASLLLNIPEANICYKFSLQSMVICCVYCVMCMEGIGGQRNERVLGFWRLLNKQPHKFWYFRTYIYISSIGFASNIMHLVM